MWLLPSLQQALNVLRSLLHCKPSSQKPRPALLFLVPLSSWWLQQNAVKEYMAFSDSSNMSNEFHVLHLKWTGNLQQQRTIPSDCTLHYAPVKRSFSGPTGSLNWLLRQCSLDIEGRMVRTLCKSGHRGTNRLEVLFFLKSNSNNLIPEYDLIPEYV